MTLVNKHEVKAFTVKELAEVFAQLVADGVGDRLVLIPNPFGKDNNAADYVSIANIKARDGLDNCVYINEQDFDDEKAINYDAIDTALSHYNKMFYPQSSK